jgi:hypothetical protein
MAAFTIILRGMLNPAHAPAPDSSLAVLADSAAVRFRRRQSHAMTPAQRLSAFLVLQRQAEQTLAANPAAVVAFHRRNRQQRRQANVRRLEAIMTQPAADE